MPFPHKCEGAAGADNTGRPKIVQRFNEQYPNPEGGSRDVSV
jgi:hypothetical protein